VSYFINQTRMAAVLIGGVDYSAYILDITLTDSSGIKNGLIATDGEIIMKYVPGTSFPQDYKRNVFQRGTNVRIDIRFPSGATRRHPRGSLYVLGTTFEPETESIVVEVGCSMALRALSEDIEDLVSRSDLYISPTRLDYSNLSNSMAAQSKILWYDSNNILRESLMYDGETQTSSKPGNFVSVFGVTTLSVQALDARTSFELMDNSPDNSPYEAFDPDDVELSYEKGPEVDEEGNTVPDDPDPDDPDPDDPDDPNDPDIPRQDLTITNSRYYIAYPCISYERVPPEEGDNLEEAGLPEDDSGLEAPRPLNCVDEEENPNPDSPAENTPGGENGETSCMDSYTPSRVARYVSASSREESISQYNGPNGALSYQSSTRYGPALEANNQFFADLFQVCRQTWATRCQPNGQCSTAPGEQIKILTKDTRQTFFYGDGSVRKIIVDSWATRLSAAQPFNWRAGQVNGLIVGFREPYNMYGLYRAQRVETTYTSSKNGAQSTRMTKTYTSTTSRQQGITQAMDALEGIVTTSVETSLTNAIDAPRPPQIEEPEIPTEEVTEDLPFPDAGGGSSGNDDGFIDNSQVKVRERVVYPIIPINGRTTVADVLARYKNYIIFTMKGESLGLRIVEPLREDICNSWAPNQSFRYCDPRYDVIMACRMDGTTWSIGPDACLISTDALTMGFSNGTLVVPDNIQGNITPSYPS